jgi:hypothetical protein
LFSGSTTLLRASLLDSSSWCWYVAVTSVQFLL